MRKLSRSTIGRGLLGVLALVVFATACDFTAWEPGGEHRAYYCDPTDTEINDGHGAGHGGHEIPYTEPKGPLSGEHCLSVMFQAEAGAQWAETFPTKAIAEANGWHWLAPWIPGQGTHHVREDNAPDAQFDFQPNMLMYDGNGGNAPLSGMVWAVVSGHMPPEGFAGDNDHWHAHEMLCFTGLPDNPFIVGDNISDSECASRGGVNVDSSDTWLVHVWLPEYLGWQPTDLFNKEHPFI